MTNSNVIELKSPSNDVLGELLKEGARQLLAKAVETELAELLEHHDARTAEDKKAVVRNGSTGAHDTDRLGRAAC